MRRLAKLPNYVRAFGVLNGVALLFRVERRTANRLDYRRRFRVPGLPHPVWLRDTVADHSIFWQVLVKREYAVDSFAQAERLTAAYDQAIRQGRRPLIIDGGANIGLSAIWFAARFPRARIVAVEPERGNLQLLRQNTAAYPNVEPVLGGLWNETGRLVIDNPTAGSAAFRVRHVEAEDSGGVPAMTIDGLMERAGCDRALIVKLDIEGAQQHLFAGNTDWVSRADLIVIELDDWQFPWQGTSRPFFSCISRYPFDYRFRGENLFCFLDTADT